MKSFAPFLSDTFYCLIMSKYTSPNMTGSLFGLEGKSIPIQTSHRLGSDSSKLIVILKGSKVPVDWWWISTFMMHAWKQWNALHKTSQFATDHFSQLLLKSQQLFFKIWFRQNNNACITSLIKVCFRDNSFPTLEIVASYSISRKLSPRLVSTKEAYLLWMG